MHSPHSTTQQQSRQGLEAIEQLVTDDCDHVSNAVPIDVSAINDLRTRTSLRSEQRLQWQRPVEMIPMSLDGMLYSEHRICGESIEISNQGISVRMNAAGIHVSQAFMLGVQVPNAGVSYAGVIVQRVESQPDGTLHCGCEFGGPAEDILNLGAMTPEFSQELMAFVLPHGPAIYENWTGAGVISKDLVDRVLVCPKCTVLPTFRHACRKCRSGRVTNDRLVHHFTCAYVGFLDEFEDHDADGLVCPKCRVRDLIIGSDYEYLTGEYRCQSCGWRDSDAEVVGHCLKCANRFDMQQARELELYRYDVHRLDALAITAQLD
jgi:predicted RNA-binding Zn-ribbon protein involved in translation (DUF1610 family)